MTTLVNGEERVSIGIEEACDGSTTKQSSISGSTGPKVKLLLAVTPGYVPVELEVGIPPSSTGR